MKKLMTNDEKSYLEGKEKNQDQKKSYEMMKKKSIGREPQNVRQKNPKKLIHDDDNDKKPLGQKKLIYAEGKHKKII